MKNLEFGPIMLVVILAFGSAIAVDENANTIESMNCSDLRNCVEICAEINNCSAYLSCLANCTIYATEPFEETTAYLSAEVAIGGAGWVQGKIVSQEGVPIPMTSIIVDGLRASVTSDEQGYYKIALSPGQHTIDPVKTGYGISPRVVYVLTGQTFTLDFIGRGTAVLGTRH